MIVGVGVFDNTALQPGNGGLCHWPKLQRLSSTPLERGKKVRTARAGASLEVW